MHHEFQIVLDGLQEPHALQCTVHRNFIHLQADPGNFHQLLVPLAFRHELLMRHNPIDHAEPLRLVRINHVTGEQEFLGFRKSNAKRRDQQWWPRAKRISGSPNTALSEAILISQICANSQAPARA